MALPVVNSSRYSTILPSTGDDIEYRPYLVKEEKIMMVALETKDNKAIVGAMKDVAKACILTENIDVENLTTFDLEWLFLRLRAKSVGEVAKVQLKCEDEQCSSMTEVNVELDDVDLSHISETRVVDLTGEVGVVMKYPTISMMEGYDTEKLKSTKGAFDMIADCIESIYDADNVYHAKDEERKAIMDFLDTLTSTQFSNLVDWMSNTPTLKKDVEWTCVGCNEERKLELRGLQSFFT